MDEKQCIICGSKAKYDLCYNCFVEKNKIKIELEGSTNTLEDTKDYYNNLKYNILRYITLIPCSGKYSINL